MKFPDRKAVPGDRASFNPVERVLPRGGLKALFKGDAKGLLPEIMGWLGKPKEDPIDLTLSRAGAEREILALAQNHLDANQEGSSKDGWKIVRGQLDAINKASHKLHSALKQTNGLTCQTLLRTGCRQNTLEWLTRLDRLQQDVSNALAIIPASNCGDAMTELIRPGTPNEMLLLGCQNIMFACGKTNVGATLGGPLENLSRLVKCLALGEDCPTGGIPDAMRSEKLKGRSKGKNLRHEAFLLVVADVQTRRAPNSELEQRAWAEVKKWA